MKITRPLFTTMAAGLFAVVLTGCQQPATAERTPAQVEQPTEEPGATGGYAVEPTADSATGEQAVEPTIDAQAESTR
jgi:hypothetical protein